MDMTSWLNRAVALIPFAPDRAAVRRELKAHLEDRADALAARGMTAKEAEAAATAAMGDPDELAWALKAVHPPLWGYLWTATRYILYILLGTLVAFCVVNQVWRDLDLDPLPEVPEAVVTVDGEHYSRRETLLQSWEPAGRAHRRGYTFSVPLAYLQEVDTTLEGERTHKYRLTVYLRACTWRFWEPISTNQDMFLFGTATDSGGVRYRCGDDTTQYFYADDHECPPGVFRLTMDLTGPEPPDWVALPVGWGGETVRLDLLREEVR